MTTQAGDEHNCCSDGYCGDCAGCTRECEVCCPRYAYVNWPADADETRRFMCDCARRACPVMIPGQRAVCGHCEGFLYPTSAEVGIARPSYYFHDDESGASTPRAPPGL